MHRMLVGVLSLMALLVLSLSAWAASPPTAQSDAPLIVADPPTDFLPPEIKVTDLERLPRSPLAAPAADSCADATPLDLSFRDTGDGSITVTNFFSVNPGDPTLSCIWQPAPSANGFRTAWHVLVAGDTSQVTITTRGTNYDTILGVYTGTCENLLTLACNDDTEGFQSEVSFRVVRGQTYYIEVADFRPGAENPRVLELAAVMAEGGTAWEQIDTQPLGGVSRHAFVSDGPLMYVIGGQQRVLGIPVLSNALSRFDVQTGGWTLLETMPGPGLSNTTAVRLGDQIYVPGGFNGNQSFYDPTHYIYNIPADYWYTGAPIPTDLLPNATPFAWAAAAPAPNGLSYFLTGGLSSQGELDPSGSALNQTFRYTPAADQWETFRPMTTARYAHTAAWVAKGNRGLCVAGGLSSGVNEDNEPAVILLTNGECYNPATGAGWQPTGPLNFPRFSAGSAVGPDGNWYIFGGRDALGAVPETEVYDPISNTWNLLGGEFSLGGTPEEPGRVWPRGAFFGNDLYAFGGNTFPEQRVISSVKRMERVLGPVPLPYQIELPFVVVGTGGNFLGYADPIGVGGVARGQFVGPTDFYDAFFFDWFEFGRAVVVLGDIPKSNNYNILLYDQTKTLLGMGDPALYGGQKGVSITLAPGRYYIVVQRIFPVGIPDPSQYYTVSVSRG